MCSHHKHGSKRKRRERMLGNRTWVGCAISKYDSHCVMVNNDMCTNQDLSSNRRTCKIKLHITHKL
jgi:hypothetical protein